MLSFSSISLPAERLLLRPFETGDAEAVFLLNNDPEVLKFTNGWKPFRDTQHAAEWIAGVREAHYGKYGYGRLAVTLRESGAVIGWSGIKFAADAQTNTLGYRFLKSHWGKGYATEAALASIAFGLHTIGLENISGFVLGDNINSARVLEKTGMVYSGKEFRQETEWDRYQIQRRPDRSHSQEPLFATERISFHEVTEEDATVMYALNLDPEVVQYTGDESFESITAARNFIGSLRERHARHGCGRWKIVERSSGECLGWCGLKLHEDTGEADVGYRLFRRHWGKGYATEAAGAAIAFGFGQLKFPGIIATARKQNTASLRVLEKCGMTVTGEGFDCGGEVFMFRVTGGEFSSARSSMR